MKWWAAFMMLALLSLASPALAQDFGDLSGTIDVSHVDAKVNGVQEETVRQLYTLNYYKFLTNYLDFRAGLRYYDFDLDAAESFGTFQEEIQPSAELSWKHPWFRFTATGSRRISRSPSISGKLINDSVLLDWKSAWVDTPVFGLRYELQDIEETGSDALRNTTNQNLTATANWDREHETFNYDISRIWSDNVIRGVQSVLYSQRFQYLGAHTVGDRRQHRFSSQYRYTRADRSAEAETGQRLLERVVPDLGLGGVDATPDQGPLASIPGLIDGNTVAPVAPPLGIGAGDLDRNIGVDLGVRRDRLAAIYVYVDRLSASSVTWTVWTSEDNLVWDSSGVTNVLSSFDATLSRYQIEFSEVQARFIKVVNGGVNPIPDVQVTEIQVFESLDETEKVELDLSSHLADVRWVWDINRKWQTSVDGVARYEPPSGSVSERMSYSYAGRAQYQQTLNLAHVGRVGQSWELFEGTSRDMREDVAGYTLLYDPLRTLGGTLSGSYRQSTEGGAISLRSTSALATAHATPWPPLRSSFEIGISGIDQPVVDYDSDAWHTRLTFDGEVTRQFRALVTWFHQESVSGSNNELRVLRNLRLSGELQITSALFARATLTLADDKTFLRSEDYLLSWRMFTRLLLTGQINTREGDESLSSERYSVNGTFDLFNRFLIFKNVTIYVRFSDVDQSGAGGSRTLSWQQGLRAAF